MFKKRTLFSVMFALIVSLVILPHGTVFAKYADGTYDVNYEMKEAGSESTSIADGYFGKPAKVTIKDGVATVQITLTGAEMIKSLSAPSGSVDVVSDSGDTRVVKFTVSDLSQPVPMDMHISVPDQPAMPGGYEQDHTARAVFDTSGISAAGSGETTTDDTTTTATPEDNPPTGDNSQIALYALLLVGSVGALYVVRKLGTARN